jgi:hypothetical protein
MEVFTCLSGTTAYLEDGKRQACAGDLTEMRNKTNGNVERNQWNRSTKSMESFNKINGIVEKNWQINYVKMAE